MKRILFVCSKNKLRSPTAEHVYAEVPGFEVTSAGTSNDADVRLSEELVEWADTIFVMEKTHKTKLQKRFRKSLNRQNVIVLGIPDEYGYMDEDLVSILKMKLDNHFFSK